MTDNFCYLLRVRYAECDAQKVVFNGKYVEYIDIAVSEYMRACMGNYNDVLSRGIDWQVVSVTVNWKAPAHFDDVIAMTVATKRIGTSSFTFEINFYNYETSMPIASSEIVYVTVSADEHQKMAIPNDMRKTLEDGAPNTTIDHAGVKNT